MTNEKEVIIKSKEYIKNGMKENEAISKALRENVSRIELKSIYEMFDVNENDLINSIKYKIR